MIQDIQPHQYDNRYQPQPPDRNSFVLYCEEHSVLVKQTPDGITFPRFSELERLNEDICPNSRWKIRRFSAAQSRSIRHLQESRDISCIFGTEIISTADAAGAFWNGTEKRECCGAENAEIWSIPRFVPQ